MPVTPFHFGPGFAVAALAPRHISWLAFCVANVMIDLESLYFLLTAQYPVHRIFHTFVGAVVASILLVALFPLMRVVGLQVWFPNVLGWCDLRLPAVAGGVILGTFSHVVLDSLMHSDITPLAPWSPANPLLGLISQVTLHVGCVGCGILGLVMWYSRSLKSQAKR